MCTIRRVAARYWRKISTVTRNCAVAADRPAWASGALGAHSRVAGGQTNTITIGDHRRRHAFETFPSRRERRHSVRVGRGQRRLAVAIAVLFLAALAAPAGAGGSVHTANSEAWYRDPRPMHWLPTSATTTALPSAMAAPVLRSAGFETGTFSELDMNQANNGSISVDTSHAYAGNMSAKATVNGGVSAQYSRGGYVGPWNTGEYVVYSASFFFPMGFRDALTNQMDLMRFDNWDDRPAASEQTGLTINVSGQGKKLYIFRNQLGVSGAGITYIAGPFDLPNENAWHQLEVRQRLSPLDGWASNALYVDGVLQGSSTTGNMFGNPGNRYNWFRAGIVASGTTQTSPVYLWFDELRLARR